MDLVAPLASALPDAQPPQFVVSTLFFVCLAIAIAVLYLACRQKFDERSVIGNDDYVYQLLPSQLATPKEYNKGFLTYFGTMVLFLCTLSFLGAKDLSVLGIKLEGISRDFTPIAIALVLAGLVQIPIPILQEIEKKLRQIAHEMAYIPRSALATAEKLSTAKFDFTAYSGEALHSEEMRGVEPDDFKQSPRTLEYTWARLACLVYEQKSMLIAGAPDSIDTSLLRAYKRDLEQIESSKRSMEQEIAAFRAERARNPGYVNRELDTAIRNNLYKLYILLGCAVRLKKHPHNDINLALERFGFCLGRPEVEDTYADLNLVGLALAALGVLALEFGAVLLTFLGLWQPSFLFPTNFEQPFTDMALALVPPVVAVMFADLMRRRAIKNNSWFGPGGRSNSANYVRVVFVCGAAGYIGLTVLGAIYAWPTAVSLKSDVPYALLAMATGGFYVWHLDNAELQTRPAWWREIAYQGLLTGVCGLIAATAAWSIVLRGAPGQVFDKIMLVGAISMTVGVIFGWYIPKGAAARIDPLTREMKERIRRLEDATNARFGPAVAAQWLDRSHPALGNQPPRAAVVTVEGYEHAMSLLQGPQALAA